MNEITSRTALTVGGSPQAIIPRDFAEVQRFAGMMIESPFCPSNMRTLPACAAAILYGAEVGLTPMMALQSIAVINNRPCLYGDGLLAVVMASPAFEDIEEVMAGTGNDRVASCTVWRVGKKKPVTRTFSVSDAKEAQLWGKAGPWTQYPPRMLQMRARSWAVRDCFPDLLRGISSAEEMMDVVQTGIEQSAPPPPEEEPAPSRSKALPGPRLEAVAEPTPPLDPDNSEALDMLDAALSELDKVDEVFAMLPAHLDGLNLTTKEEEIVEAMVDRHVNRITQGGDVVVDE